MKKTLSILQYLYKGFFLLVATFMFASNVHAQTSFGTLHYSGSAWDNSPAQAQNIYILSDEFTLQQGQPIQSVKLINPTMGFSNMGCGTGWAYNLTVDGVTLITNGCASDFDSFPLPLGFDTAIVSMADLDQVPDFWPFELDVLIEYTTPSCIAPTVDFKKVKSASAEIHWTSANTGTPLSYILEYGPSGSTYGSSANTVVANVTSPYAVSGLASDTEYNVWLREVCSVVDTSYPLTQALKTTPDYCGGALFEDPTTNGLTYTINTKATYTMHPDNPGDKIHVRFRELELSGSSDDFIKVYDGEDTTATLLATLSGYPTPLPSPFTSTHSSGALTFYFESDAFYWVGQEKGWKAEVYCIGPDTCVSPSTLVLDSIQNSSIAFSWDSVSVGDTATQYYWVVVADGDAPSGPKVDSGFTTSLSAMSTVLAPYTDYDIYVTTECGMGNFSHHWEGPLDVRMDYCIPSPNTVIFAGISQVVFGGSGNQVINSSQASPTGYEDFTSLTGDMHLGVPNPLEVTIHSFYNSMSVAVWIDLNDDWDFDDLGEEILVANAANYNPTTERYQIMLPSNTPLGQHRMRVGTYNRNLASGNNADPCLDIVPGAFEDYTVNVLDTPSCVPPTSVSVSAITPYGCDIDWVAPSAAPIQYMWKVVDSGMGALASPVASGTVAGSLSKTRLGGLQPDSSYHIYVSSICGSDTSVWGFPTELHTACAPLMSYYQDFENYSPSYIPDCWQRQNPSGADSWKVDFSSYWGCQGNKALCVFSSNGDQNAWAYSPYIDMTAGTSYRLSFIYGNGTNGSNSIDRKMEVYLTSVQDSQYAAAGKILFRDTTIDYGNYNCQYVCIDFMPDSSGVYSLAFHGFSLSNSSAILFIDSIGIEPSPSQSAMPLSDRADDDLCTDMVLRGVTGEAWHQLIHNGEIVAGINPHGNEMGSVDFKTMDSSGVGVSTLFDGFTTLKYMPRTIAITPEISPATPVDLRLYYQGQELDALNASTSGYTFASTNYEPNDLILTKHDENMVDCQVSNNITAPINLSFVPTDLTIGSGAADDFVIEFPVSSFSEFWLRENENPNPLTIFFEDFKATPEGTEVLLSWKLNMQNEAGYIQVQKLFQNQWQVIKEVALSEAQNYFYTDQKTQSTNIYRLVYKNKTSQTLRVDFSSLGSFDIFPNPTMDGFFTLQIPDGNYDDLQIIVSDILGQVVHTKCIKGATSENHVTIDCSHLTGGRYFFNVLAEGASIFKSNIAKL